MYTNMIIKIMKGKLHPSTICAFFTRYDQALFFTYVGEYFSNIPSPFNYANLSDLQQLFVQFDPLQSWANVAVVQVKNIPQKY